MASISANGAKGHHKFTLNVTETGTSVANNTSNVSFNLQLSPIQSGWDWYISGISYKITINGTDYTGTIPSYNGSSTVTIKSGTQSIPHNSDGSKTLNFSFSITDSAGMSYTPASASGNLTLTKIARYTSISTFTVGKRSETSVTVNWKTADTIDYLWHSKDNGSTWTGLDVTDGTSGSFNIGGLSPNTKYNFKIRVRRKDSQLTTDSSTVAQTTYKIPTQSLNIKTETTIKINWSIDSTADYIWYSKDNGKTWVAVGSVNATSGSYTISSLTPNTTYSIKTRVRRKASQTTYDTASLSVTTFKAPTQAFKSKTETSIAMNWACDSTVDYIWYSKDNGSTWTGLDVADGTSGSYTINGLTANTRYNIKTRCRRKASQTTYDTGATSQTTYDYPYCTVTPDFTIGNAMDITLYNPLKRNCTVKMLDVDGSTIYSGDGWTGTSVGNFATATIINNLYKSIPNSQSGKYKIVVNYGSSSKTKDGGTYKIKGTETPTMGSFNYEDSKSSVVGVTGNKLYIVKNQSTLKVTIPSANKMVTKNSATPKRYEVSCGNRSGSVNYGTGDVSIDLGTISVAGNTDITVKAYDSRGLSVTKKITIAIIDYVNIAQKNTFARLNNFENTTTLVTKGTFALVKCGNSNKNTIQSVKYRYAKIENNYDNTWLSLTPVINNNGYTCQNVILDLDNQSSWKIQVEVKDKLTTSTMELMISEGIPILYTNASRKNVGIGKVNSTGEAYSLAVAGNIYLASGNTVVDYDVVDEW